MGTDVVDRRWRAHQARKVSLILAQRNGVLPDATHQALDAWHGTGRLANGLARVHRRQAQRELGKAAGEPLTRSSTRNADDDVQLKYHGVEATTAADETNAAEDFLLSIVTYMWLSAFPPPSKETNAADDARDSSICSHLFRSLHVQSALHRDAGRSSLAAAQLWAVGLPARNRHHASFMGRSHRLAQLVQDSREGWTFPVRRGARAHG